MCEVINYYNYLTINTVNNMKYVGARTCHCQIEDDPYLGSGVFFKQAIERYGEDKFIKVILYECKTWDECLEKEKEIISTLDAVNSREYYNVAPGGASRPQGFIPSVEEVEKMEYLKNMMNNESVYGVKVEYNKERNEKGLIPRITFVKTYNNNGYGTFHTMANDTDKVVSKKGNNGVINVLNTITKFYDPKTVVNWLKDKRYTIISKEKYDYYRIKSTESSEDFYNVSKQIEADWQNSIKKPEVTTRTVEKTSTINVSLAPKAQLDSMGCVVELAKKSKDYSNFLKLVNTYSDIGIAGVYYAVTSRGSISDSSLKNGQLKCSSKQVEQASNILNYERKFQSIGIKGRRDYFNVAIAFCYKLGSIDNDVLYRKVKKAYNEIPAIKSIEQAIEIVDGIYNRRLSKDKKVLIKQEYLKSKLLKEE